MADACWPNPSARRRPPNLIDRHQWRLVHGSPQSVLAFIASHMPAGSHRVFSGSGTEPGGPIYVEDGYGWPAVPGVLGTRQLAIAAVQLHAHTTAVRVDAQDEWISPRPASERNSPGTTRLQLVVTRGPKVQQGPIAFVSTSKLQRVASLLNELPLAQHGAYACPNDPGIRIMLKFFAQAAGSPLAIAVVNPGGCGGVQLTLNGRRQPTLASRPIPGEPSSRSLVAVLQSDLGVRLDISPLTPYLAAVLTS